MTTHHQWLQAELSQWEKEGLVNANQSASLRRRYPVSAQTTGSTEAASKSWASMLLPLLGTILIGLGVVLFFSYNLAAKPKALKLASVFVSILVAHGLGIMFSSQRRHNALLSESFHLVGTMLFGAGIWLIAQIYHIDEHFPNGILLWGTGALLMAWALRSLPQAVLAAALFAVWAGFETIGFTRANPVGGLVFLVGLLPLAWWMKSRVLVFIALAGFFFTTALTLSWFSRSFSLHHLFFVACLVLALATLVYRTNFPQSAAPIRVAALIVYAIPLFALSFGRANTLIQLTKIPPGWLTSSYWVLFGLAVAAWLVSMASGAFTRDGKSRTLANALVLASLLLVALLRFAPTYPALALPIMLAANLIIVAHAIGFIQNGAQRQSWQQSTVGFLVLGALIAARFTDLFSSLLARSLAFLVFGISLFVVGYWYARRKQKLGARDA